MRLILSIVLLAATEAAAADAPVTSTPNVQVTTSDEGGKKILLATVTAAGHPVEGAAVKFAVKRTFGWMPVGHDQTLDDGTAAVDFPQNLPGDQAGNLTIALDADVEGAKTHTELVIGGVPRNDATSLVPRALWSSRAPLGLVIAIFSLLAGVWSVYVFVITRLIGIRNDGLKGAST